MLRGIASFFEKFAFSGSEGRFAGVDAPGRELEQIVLSRVAILTLKKYEGLGASFVNRQDDDRAGVTDDFTNGGDTVGLDDAVASDVEYATAKDGLGGKDCRLR